MKVLLKSYIRGRYCDRKSGFVMICVLLCCAVLRCTALTLNSQAHTLTPGFPSVCYIGLLNKYFGVYKVDDVPSLKESCLDAFWEVLNYSYFFCFEFVGVNEWRFRTTILQLFPVIQ